MQRAQVVSLAHHLLAYVEMLQRDVERLENAYRRCDVLPLGSGALAATTLAIDREVAAAELGFSSISANSLDAVSDRDFAVEIVFACALLMIHLSRLGEELVLWTTSEFGFAELPDAYATGSSLMPQKKNPDVLELARGRSGRTVGALVSLLTMLKGQPLAYNRDLQEDKQPLFDSVDIAASSLGMLTEVVRVLRFDTAAMGRAAGDPGLLATDVAEWLVAQGVPFRQAHGVVARAVRRAAEERRSLAGLSAAEWSSIDPRVGPEVTRLFDPQRGLRRREVPGGPGPRSVSRQLARGAAMVRATRRRVDSGQPGGSAILRR
jgi:argininosuccinate lyase